MYPVFLREITWSAAAGSREDLNSVPEMQGNLFNYVHSLMVDVEVALTSAATSDAIVQHQFAGIVDEVQVFNSHGKPWFDTPLSGPAIRILEQYMLRKGPADPTAIAANSNTTHTCRIILIVPYVFPQILTRPYDLMPLAAELHQMYFKWAAANTYGTGQTIGATTRARIYANLVPRPQLKVKDRVRYGWKTPARFEWDTIPINGRLLAAIVADDSAAATATIGTTDFTDYELQGREVNVGRQAILAPTYAYNSALSRFGDAHDAYRPLVTVAAVTDFPLFTPGEGTSIGSLPREGDLRVRLITGAGAPAVTDQIYLWARLTGRPELEFATVIGNSREIDLTRQGVLAALDPVVESTQKKGVPLGHPVATHLPRRINVKAAKRKG